MCSDPRATAPGVQEQSGFGRSCYWGSGIRVRELAADVVMMVVCFKSAQVYAGWELQTCGTNAGTPAQDIKPVRLLPLVRLTTVVYSKARLAALAAELKKRSPRILLCRSSMVQTSRIPALWYVTLPKVDV